MTTVPCPRIQFKFDQQRQQELEVGGKYHVPPLNIKLTRIASGSRGVEVMIMIFHSSNFPTLAF